MNNMVSIPSMRNEMIYYIEHLQDEEFQRRAWKEKSIATPVTPFDDLIHFLYETIQRCPQIRQIVLGRSS